MKSVWIFATLALTACAQADGPYHPTLGQSLRGFGRSLQGKPNQNAWDAAKAKNETYNYLVGNGIDPETAKTAIDDPHVMQVVLGQIASKS
jgi:hypothetical protein